MQNINDHIPLSALCDEKVWKYKSLWRFLWYPIGFVLVLIRIIGLFIHFLLALPFPASIRNRYHLKSLRFLMGHRMQCNLSPEEIARLTDGCVVSVNHISLYDAFNMLSLPHAVLLVGNSTIKTVNIFSLLSNYAALVCSGGRFLKVTERREFASRIVAWRANPAGTALYTSPEKTIGNGQGLFHFHSAFVCYKMPVVPLALSIELPFGLNPHPLLSSGSAIFLRLMMMPWVKYKLTFLSPIQQSAGQSKTEFAQQVQQAIADHLNIPATNWTEEDKHAWRRLRKDQTGNTDNAG